MASALLQASILVFSVGFSCQAMAIECGGQPENVPSSIQQSLSGDVEGKAQAFTKLLGDASLKGKVDASKAEIYQKYQNLDKSQIDKYMIWISCQTINEDRMLKSSEKLELFMNVYKAIETPPLPPPPPKPQPYTVVICTGEHEKECAGGHSIFKTCGSFGDDNAEAAAACKGARYRATRLNTKGGNKCGYNLIEATCN